VVSVEHHPHWFKFVNETLDAEGLSISYLYFTLGPAEPGRDPGDPLNYSYAEHDVADWRPYVTTIEAYPDSYFDLVFVDGGPRSSCIWHAHSKVAPGGYLLLDDSERTWYCEKLIHLFDGWQRHDFESMKGTVPSKATFWRRDVSPS